MNKTKGFLRIAAILSVLWVIYCYTQNTSAITGFGVNDFLMNGIAPVVVFWGLVWIISGFRDIASDPSNKDEDNEGK